MNNTRPNILDSLAAKASDASLQNLEAERAVLAALMRNPDPNSIITLGISADLFSQDVTREAFQAIAGLIADGAQPDVVLLKSAISNAALTEVETAWNEHASTVNMRRWVKLLQDCKRNRTEQAARNRLIQAAAANVPTHELQAIVESIRQAGQGDGRRSTFVGLGEMLNTPPAENWLIKSWIPSDSIIVIFGDSGTGKSFVTIDLLCHIAAGIPWLGSETRKGIVLYIAGEGQNGIIRRFKAWFEHHGHSGAVNNILLRTIPAALCDATATADLVAEIAAMPIKPVAIAIDTLARNFGPGDENATRDMNQFVAGVDAIRLATQAAIITPHHSGHAEKTRARGSSVLKAAIDTEFCIEKDGDTVSMRCPKMKDAEAPPPVAWTLARQALPWCDADGTPMNSAVLVPTEAVQNGTFHKDERLTVAQRIALDALRTALTEHGVDDRGVVAVAEDQWRQAAYNAGIASSDATQQAKRRAFQRARETLISTKLVCTHAGNYWLPIGGTKRYKAVHVPECTAGYGQGTAVQSGTHPYRGVPHVPPACTPVPDAGDVDKYVPHVPSAGERDRGEV